ncbi:hypothetical protein PHYSODRAFT_494381 [Phytophthora sojae]|uniref:Mos1 transposase HTH domain-containing protein n=1 Tax=Phytophthora sojae (strain P6497) TaxID=1094619 RepID=G4Z9E1_PHYSP|nr:hypothetical protein PHYSODRAFT_494381 [Phytophthora sojae]EGZ21942.1 hypothetical protein PHYSODRAFT_494381 [Phytophthora sojae]|eukprot:XP_009524659.1 hypothetical protein PHYSODRAFT_494381 [Phytophthora sojae]
MPKSSDLRWRAVTLVHVYDVEMSNVVSVLGVSVRSVQRWYGWFQSRGNVEGVGRKQRTSRWPPEVCRYGRDS